MFKYPIRIVNEPGQVFNVARFDATSKSSSAASSLFTNANISMDFVNVGQEGKIEKSGNNSSDEEAAAPKKKVWSRAKSKIPSMRRARERKLFLKEQSTDEEKFTGLKDGKLGEDTYVCVFHKLVIKSLLVVSTVLSIIIPKTKQLLIASNIWSF